MRMLAGAAGLFLAALGSAAGEPLDGWLPEGTLFYLSLEDPARSDARLREGRYAEVRGDPGAQRLAVEAKTLVAEARRHAAECGEIWLGRFWELARGQVVLAVVRARGREAPLVLLDLGDRPFAFRDHLDRLAGTGAVGPEASRDYRGERVRMRSGGEGAGAVFWLQRGPVVALSWREGVVEEIVDHLRERGGGLALRRDYAAVRSRLPRDADVALFLPREALRELEHRSTDVRELVEALGLPEDAALGLTISLAPDALEVHAFLFAPRPRRKLLAILDEPNAALAPPPHVPPDARMFVAARLDLGKVLDFAREAEGGIPAERVPLARAFVRALGDEFALVRVGPRNEEVFVAEVDREAWMRRLLAGVTVERGGVYEGPDGAVALRDGWLLGAGRAAALHRLLADRTSEWHIALAPLPARRVMVWYAAPRGPRSWDDPSRLFGAQSGALVNDPLGLLVVHRVALR